MKRFVGLGILSLLLSSVCFADTLTVMHYNLMYYNHDYDDCNCETNNVHKKNNCLATILEYVQPDILTVNEVGSTLPTVNMIMDSTLNINGVNRYSRADMVQEQYMTNMIYYNTEILELISQSYANSSPRKTQFYNFKLLNSNNPETGLPVTLTCGVTHLKAGSYSENVTARKVATELIMNYIDENIHEDNVLFMGDLNLYTSSEPAFQNLTTPTANTQFRLYDPINRVGEWGSNSNYRQIHTQSTHSAETPCFSHGGMDDRFDFILSSNQILNGSEGLTYKKYRTIGQDGNRYNQSLISPSNTSVPADVLNALYNMSDHLPVVMKLVYQRNGNSVPTNTNQLSLKYSNPITDKLRIIAEGSSVFFHRINIYSLIGNVIYTAELNNYSQIFNYDASKLNRGIYIVEIQMTDGNRQTIKIIKQ